MSREASGIILLALAIVPLAVNLQPASAQFEASGGCVNLDARPLYLNYDITQAADSNHTIMELSLHENDTGRVVDEASFSITFSDAKNETLVDLFYTNEGILRLDFVNGTGPIQIFGNRAPFQNALQADPGGSIRIVNFPFKDKAFKVSVEVFSIDYIRNVCDEGEVQPVEFLLDGEGHDAGKIQVMPEFGSIIVSALLAATIGAVIAHSKIKKAFKRNEMQL